MKAIIYHNYASPDDVLELQDIDEAVGKDSKRGAKAMANKEKNPTRGPALSFSPGSFLVTKSGINPLNSTFVG